LNKLLTFEIEHCSPLPFVLLHNDIAIQQLMERFFFKDSLIYFICKVKKLRFDMSSLKIENQNITVNLIFDNEIIPAHIIVNKEISLLKGSNNKLLILNVEGWPHPMYVTPDKVIRDLNKNVGNKPELLYIGYSFEPVNRLLGHEKIVKASAEIEDEYELRLYVSSFKFSYCFFNGHKQLICINDIGVRKDVTSDEELKDHVMLAERILINYFQTEGLNDHHINMNIRNDIMFKRILKKNGIRFIGGGYEMEDGEYFDFLSQNRTDTEKSFYIDYENPNDGYLNHDETMKRFLE
jgi:hypothetical protein